MQKLKTENFKFHQHKECEFFPCHKIKNEDEFNCLFCFCPLYTLQDKCGGNFKYTKKNVKDCSNCVLPHTKGAYEHIMSKMDLIIKMGSKKD